MHHAAPGPNPLQLQAISRYAACRNAAIRDERKSNGVQEALSSNLNTRTILTKRYRCVWRKVRRINRFRAFSSPDFFSQTIDANRCFRASAPIRTGHFPFSGRCVQPAPFFSGVFPAGSGIFLKKESQRFGRRFVGPDGLRKRRPFSFQKGRWSQRLHL